MPNENHNKSSTASRWLWFHRFGSPTYFYGFANRWSPRFALGSLLLAIVGIYWGLFIAPPDYQMGDSYRLIYIHVPSAWMSMSIYMVMAVASATALIWRMKLGFIVARACAPIGAIFTFCALLTGSLWGKPTWGTYWIWDARLTSELVLLFLYLGYIALTNAIEDRRAASQAGAILALVGVINIPIIHYSVEWWNTLHQGSTVTQFGKPTMDTSMLIPLLIMFIAVNLYFASVMLCRAKNILLDEERQTSWVKNIVQAAADR